MKSTVLSGGVRVRRGRLACLGAATLAIALMLAANVAVAQQGSIGNDQPGSVPSTGGARPGPVAIDPGPVALKRGIRPVALQIADLDIAADIETINIVDGKMQDPTGPFIVSWYQETAGLGQIGNVVLAGHVDYWNVGEAIFFDVYYGDQLQPGDQISVTGEDGEVFTYQVIVQELYHVDDLTPETITDLIFPTGKDETLTLITCGGEFDYGRNEYTGRVIVVAERIFV